MNRINIFNVIKDGFPKHTDYRKYDTDKGEIVLNDEQYKIVTADKNENMRIIACAGSGKTTTVTCRIRYLCDNDINPSSIILTTFNVDAAESMKSRIQTIFKYMPKIRIGTIDSIAYCFYMTYFKKEGYVGVSEFSTELLKFLNSPDGHKITDQYKYLFFDEFQDCNQIQFEILKKFHDAGCIITVIGDDAQNIYQWRGSNIDYILNFNKHIPDAVTYKLVNNYRSTEEIINLANASIAKNKDQIPKDMIATRESIGFKPRIVKYRTEEHQANSIIQKILSYYDNNIQYHDIAVISRTNYSLKIIEECIEKYNKSSLKKLPYIALISDDMKDGKPKLCKDHICLTTIHKAKGLEWDTVFLVSCNDDRFPADIEAIAIEEERRLFYVAVTRAKRHLEISFTNESVTRFISELDRKYYNFIDFRSKYFDPVQNRDMKFKSAVTELIDMLEQKDIEKMRRLEILPKLVPVTESVGREHKYHDDISKYYLQTDFGIFIDRYISRSFGLQNPVTNGLEDSIANRIINSLVLLPHEYNIYNKYNVNISKKLTTELFSHHIDSIIFTIDRDSDDPTFVKSIDDKDNYMLKNIIKKIISSCKNLNIAPSQLFIVSKAYLPNEFVGQMVESYKKFLNPTIKNDFDTLRNIYNVSICQNVYENRRRLLYKDVYSEFISNKEIFDDIDNWIKNYVEDDIIIKLQLRDTDLIIDGEIDMIDMTTHTLIDFKTSVNECKLEWIIQMLTYVALLKKINKYQTNYIQIYNPLLGKLTTFDISDWDKTDELLEFLSEIRNSRMARTKKLGQ